MFEKGKSGNPNGRPKRRDDIIDKLSPSSERFVNNLISIANGEIEDIKVSDMLKANELALAYLYGKPVQQVNANVNDNRLINTSNLTPDQKAVLAEVALASLESDATDD